MLETIQEFAAERLGAEDEDAVRRRHRAYVVGLAEAAAPHLHSAEERVASTRLAPDYANIRVAISHALAAGEPDDAARILGALYPFLISHGNLGEAREWVDATLAAGARLSSRGLAETLVAGGEIARFAGDFDRAIELKEKLASGPGELQRPNWAAATLADLCEIALDQGDLAQARGYADQAAAAGAGARVELCFAELALREGDLRSAESHCLAALDGLQEGAFNHACGLEILGETLRRSGDVVQAGRRFSAALRSFAELRDGGGIADCFEGLARLAASSSEVDRAGRLLGAAEALREQRGRRAVRSDVPTPEAPDAAREEGRAMDTDDAVAYALG
jgi:non-specific serine/threonine protein kinase